MSSKTLDQLWKENGNKGDFVAKMIHLYGNSGYLIKDRTEQGDFLSVDKDDNGFVINAYNAIWGSSFGWELGIDWRRIKPQGIKRYLWAYQDQEDSLWAVSGCFYATEEEAREHLLCGKSTKHIRLDWSETEFPE